MFCGNHCYQRINVFAVIIVTNTNCIIMIDINIFCENVLFNIFSAQFIRIISHHKKIGHNINVLQQTACLVDNPITVDNFAFLFNCTPVGRTSDSMMVPTLRLIY